MSRMNGFWKALLAIAAIPAVGMLGRKVHRHCCHPDPDRARKFVTWKVDRVLNRLNAETSQRSKVHELKDRLLGLHGDLHASLVKAKKELVSQLHSDNPDSAKVHSLVDESAESLKQFFHKVADAALELHTILTPAQRKQLAECRLHRCGCSHNHC